VDFAALRTAVAETGLYAFPLINQHYFLRELGIGPRTEALLKVAAADDEAEALYVLFSLASSRVTWERSDAIGYTCVFVAQVRGL
jgi:SAM-dependent MidA family methyltransferase